jgi:(1->4)-alpha-D-glucan 1-alpha-D-glucosylmutase
MLKDLTCRQGKDRLGLMRQLLANWSDGRVKLYVTRESLSVRGERRDLFENGEYVPLVASGLRSDHVCAFGRSLAGRWVLAMVPRLVSQLALGDEPPMGEGVWQDTVLRLPDGAPRKWKNAFTGEFLSVGSGTSGLSLGAVFRSFPVALLTDS